ncbi:5'-nucleotidase C-terminal domain-containing protein [Pedobacter cryoconitis]|uniref:2',3'-cyclic-nucleotide 2'-phosphodiesterase (5'-nucleotidase family) n=1 Tax=Pedobacter cryoconitis TaxID=188932 RepID=A0A7X0MHA8_9SPHI|nr:5'-nucleotidase [Pedobacter cryoconitis]MBB6498631.1 2',3'-cyclic-nucleotide 2'-phosphodiesterase (5'-nucleotidase family) [Pedobacter cryoconitis]
MHTFIPLKTLSFILGPLLLYSCSSNYHLVKSNRTEYAVTKEVKADSSIIRTYQPYKLKLDSQMNVILGYSENLLEKKMTGGESVLGDFFSDAALAEARKTDPQIDFTMPSTNGGLRNDLPSGAITLANVFQLMPFENELIVFEIKGTEVQSLLDYIARTGGQPVSGLKMKIVAGKPAAVIINGQPFDQTKNYHVLTSDYIAGGADGISCFKKPVASKVLNLKIRDALISYIKETQARGEKISTKLDGRITHD